jgi:hypothetical protein
VCRFVGAGVFLIRYYNDDTKVAITEIYPWIPWEPVADPLVSAERTLGSTAPDFRSIESDNFMFLPCVIIISYFYLPTDTLN